MSALPVRTFRLSQAGRSISCDMNGAFIGSIPLLKRVCTAGKDPWEARNTRELSAELSTHFDLPIDFSSKAAGLNAIARSLNEGRVAHAQLVTLHLQFPEPPPLAKSAAPQAWIAFIHGLHSAGLLHRAWNPNQPRWPAGAPNSQGGEFAPRNADLGFETPGKNSGDNETEVVANTPRISQRTVRRAWERAEGKFGPRTPQRVEHGRSAHSSAGRWGRQ